MGGLVSSAHAPVAINDIATQALTKCEADLDFILQHSLIAVVIGA